MNKERLRRALLFTLRRVIERGPGPDEHRDALLEFLDKVEADGTFPISDALRDQIPKNPLAFLDV